jgi:hypothetical protein
MPPPADVEFREFAGGFAQPLTALAFLCVAGLGPDAGADADAARDVVLRTLAVTRRRWRDARETGAPQQVAVEVMASSLPRHAPAGQPMHDAPVRSYALVPPEPTESAGTAAEDADPPSIEDALQAAAWAAWRAQPPRVRLALVMPDIDAVVPRLADTMLPAPAGVPWRRRDAGALTLSALDSSVRADPDVRRWLAAGGRLSPGDVRAALLAVLHARAYDAVAPTDPVPVVDARVRRRRRQWSAVWTAAVAAVTALAIVASVSTSRHDRARAAAARASAAAAGTSAAPAATRPTPRPIGFPPDWPIRGNLAGDSALAQWVTARFVTNHPDAIGDVRVLLAATTPWSTIALVTAASQSGVVRAWYFGPLGVDQLIEAHADYVSPAVAGDGTVVNALVDQAGHTTLAVIAPPAPFTTVDLLDSGTSPAVSHTLPATDGVSLDDISGRYVPALTVAVRQGDTEIRNGAVELVQLSAPFVLLTPAPSGSAKPSAPSSVFRATLAPVESVPFDRGSPDPQLVAKAIEVERQWIITGALDASGEPVVLWGGRDAFGADLVVLRVKTLHLTDLVVVVWSTPFAGDGEYLLAPDTPDFPIGFEYPDATTTAGRIGVVAPPGAARAQLVVDGVSQGSQPIDDSGFASLIVTGEYGTLVEQTFSVELFDAAGNRLTTVQVPPRA